MKETKKSVISATLIDGKHMEFKADVDTGSENLAKVFAGLVFTVAQGTKQSLMENGANSKDANDATWGLLDAAFATAKYDKEFARMMNHEREAEKPKDEGIAVVTIGKGEPIPEDWPEGLRRIIEAIRSDAEDDEE